MDDNTSNETIWWFLGTDTEHVWHQRRIRAPSKEVALSWWIERTGRDPDVAWSARESIARIDEGLQQLAKWPHIPGEAPPNWFLGWLGHPRGETTLVAVPAADEEHAYLVLASEQPECTVKILGDVSALEELRTGLAEALTNPYVVDADLFNRPRLVISPDLSAWLDQQLDMEYAP